MMDMEIKKDHIEKISDEEMDAVTGANDANQAWNARAFKQRYQHADQPNMKFNYAMDYLKTCECEF